MKNSNQSNVRSLALGALGAALALACGAEPMDTEDFTHDDSSESTAGAGESAPEAEGTVGDGETVEKASFPTGQFACTGSQQITVLGDELRAGDYLDSIAAFEPSLILFGTPESFQLIENHFAPDGADELQFIFDTYRNIRANLANTSYTCPPEDNDDCDDAGGVIARTAKASSLTRLCPLYFEQTPRERAKTIIHELSHQNRTSPDGRGTDDLTVASIRNAHQYGIYAPRCFEGTCLPF